MSKERINVDIHSYNLSYTNKIAKTKILPAMSETISEFSTTFLVVGGCSVEHFMRTSKA